MLVLLFTIASTAVYNLEKISTTTIANIFVKEEKQQKKKKPTVTTTTSTHQQKLRQPQPQPQSSQEEDDKGEASSSSSSLPPSSPTLQRDAESSPSSLEEEQTQTTQPPPPSPLPSFDTIITVDSLLMDLPSSVVVDNNITDSHSHSPPPCGLFKCYYPSFNYYYPGYGYLIGQYRNKKYSSSKKHQGMFNISNLQKAYETEKEKLSKLKHHKHF